MGNKKKLKELEEEQLKAQMEKDKSEIESDEEELADNEIQLREKSEHYKFLTKDEEKLAYNY